VSTKDDEQTKSSNNSDLLREIEKVTEKKTVLAQEINDSSSRLLTDSDTFKQETEDTQIELSKELQAFNNTVVTYRKEANEIAGQILDGARQFASWSEELYERVKMWLFIILGLALITFLAGYVAFWVFSVDFSYVSIVLLVIGVLILINVALGQMHEKINKVQEQVVLHTQEGTKSVSRFVAQKLGLKTDPRNLNAKLSSIVDEVQRVGAAVRSYIPYLDELYSGKNRLHRLQLFTQTLRNAIKSFGIELDAQSEDSLRKFGSMEDNENEWLVKASEKLSKQLSIPNEIISIAYYEYVDNAECKKNEWNNIVNDSELLRQMSRILCRGKVVDVRYFSAGQSASFGAIEELLRKIDVFSLEGFRAIYYGFYTELTRNKRSLINAISEYGIKFQQTVENDILTLVPATIKPQEWTDELIEKAAKLCSLKKDFIGLVFWDKMGEHEKRRKSWENILRSETVEDTVRVLLDHKLLQVPDNYTNAQNLTAFIGGILSQQSDYNLLSVTKIVSEAFSDLDNQKKVMLQCIGSYAFHLSEDERNEFYSMLPQDLRFKEALLTQTARLIHASEPIVRLLLYEYVGNRAGKKTAFGEIRNSDLVEELSSLLIDQGKIDAGDQVQIAKPNLSAIIKSVDDFDVKKLQVMYWKYSSLLSYSSKMSEFLLEEKMIERKTALEHRELQQIMRDKIEATTYEQLKFLMQHLTKQRIQTLVSSNSQDLEAVVVAAITLFLSQQHDIIARQACKEAAQLKTASRILYQYVRLAQEKGLGVKTISLLEIAKGVISGEYADYMHLSDFESQLSIGLLFSSIKELLAARLESVKNQLANRDLLVQTLSKVQQAVKDFINAELQEDMIILSLNSQLISAYLITTMSEKKVIQGVIDSSLVDLCDELAQTDYAYKDFLLLEKERKVTGGRYTRIGLVPIRMTFDEFSDKFHTLFTNATEAYMASHDVHGQLSDYSVNLIRIFPSNAAFKLVKGGSGGAQSEIDPVHPVHTIKRLMVEKLGLVDNLEFVASLKSEDEKTIALKRVVASMFDTRTSIYLLIKQVLSQVISTHQKLFESMKNKDFDQELMAQYSCGTLSQLATKIHDLQTALTEDDKQKVRGQFKLKVKNVVTSKAKMRGDDLDIFSDAVFTILDEIGTILSA
jgi:hypothetical protein